MNPYKLKNVFEYLTSNNQLLKKKLKLGTDDIPIPPKRDDVTTIEAINRFNKANPRVDTTNLKPLSVKHSNVRQSNVNEPNEGVIQGAFDTATREAQSEGFPAPSYDKFKSRYLKRNMKADGGMLVQPSDDGSRPGYKEDKYITPAKRTGADNFQGQKHYVVKDDSYSDGRKKVKTKEYSAWLKNEQEKHKKNPNRYKQMSNPRREPGLLRIAEAMQQADIYDDAEYMMPNKKAMKVREKDFDRKMKVFKKGMLEAGDIVYITNLERNFDDVIFIADQLGESPDWVLDMLDERTNFRDFSRGAKDLLKKDPKYTKPRNDYLKVENWVQSNAKRYANPETFENALIKRFGKDNQFVKDMKSKSSRVTTYFSEGFKKTMLNSNSKTMVVPSHLKQFIKSSLYNFNPKIKNAVTEEIKGIFNSENLPKLRTESRKLLSNNKLLAKFGLDKTITGPFAKVIQAEIGQQMWDDITNFRQHRVGTQEMLKAFEQIVADEFKPMFAESAKAIGHSKNNQWAKAKEVFGIADNVAWDHKIPSSLIDKGYADIIEYTKVNPTTSNFNERIKNAQFDRPINKLVTKFEKATTLDAKAKIKNQMDILKNNFSEKYSGYLDEVSINLDKQGNLKFSSSASPLSMSDDRVKMLGTSLVQEGTINEKQMLQKIQSYSKLSKCKVGAADGGRIGFAYSDECIRDGLKEQKIEAQKGNKKAAQELVQVGKVATRAGLLKNLLGPGAILGEAVVEGAIIGNKVLGGKPSDIAWAESYLSYLDPRKYSGQLDPLEMSREDMTTRVDFNDPDYPDGKTIDGPNANILRSGFAAQDQVSAFNEAVNEKLRGESAGRLDIANKAAADIREQSKFVDQSKDIISSDAFQDATRQAQEYIQGQTGENMAKYRLGDFGKYESGQDRDLRMKREKEMLEKFPMYTPEVIDSMYQQANIEKPENLNIDIFNNIMRDQDKMNYFAENFRLEKASGGIASLTDTIPPESGPTPHGLRYQYNNVKKI